jgi:hypothetical protein
MTATMDQPIENMHWAIKQNHPDCWKESKFTASDKKFQELNYEM